MSNIAVLRKMAQETLRPIEEIPKEVLEMPVEMFLTRRRLISVGTDPGLAKKIVEGLLRYRQERMKNLIAKHLHVIPRVGKTSLDHVINAINAACLESETEKA